MKGRAAAPSPSFNATSLDDEIDDAIARRRGRSLALEQQRQPISFLGYGYNPTMRRQVTVDEKEHPFNVAVLGFRDEVD